MANSDFYLQVSGIRGQSKEKLHIGWIDLLSAAWPGGSPEARKVLNAVKVVDASSGALRTAVNTGTRFESAVLEVTILNGGHRTVAQKYSMKGVRITSYDLTGTRIPSEWLTLEFDSVESEYRHLVVEEKNG